MSIKQVTGVVVLIYVAQTAQMPRLSSGFLNKQGVLMANIFELAMKIENLILENEGEFQEDVDALIQVTEHDLAHKIDSYYYVIEKMKAAAAFYKSEAEKLNKIKKACETTEDRLKTRLKEFMTFTGTEEIEGVKSRFKLYDAQPKLVILDEKLIPKEYQKITIEIDRASLKTDLVHGKKVEGATLQQSSALRMSFKPQVSFLKTKEEK